MSTVVRIPRRADRILDRLRGNRLAQNVGWSFGGQVCRAVSTAALLVLAARTLNPDGFGTLAGVIALVALVAPFGSLGAMNLLMRRVAVDPGRAAGDFASAVAVTLISGLALGGVLVVLQASTGLLPVSVSTLAFVAIADLFAMRLVEIAGAARQAEDWIIGTAFFPVILMCARLVGVLLLTAHGPIEVSNFALVYGLTSILTAAVIVVWTARVLGFARPRPTELLVDWRDGVLFSLGLSAQGVYNDVDKIMLTRLSTLPEAGAYAAAYRIIDLAFVPMRAILGAAYIRFFRAGAAGLSGSIQIARGLAVPSLGVSIVASLSLLLGADLLPVILGSDYRDVVGMARWLAVIPLLRTIHYLAADSLTGAGLQGARSACQLSIAVANVLLNLALIPAFGAKGAVATSIAADTALAVALWLIVRKKLRAERHRSAKVQPTSDRHPGSCQAARPAGGSLHRRTRRPTRQRTDTKSIVNKGQAARNGDGADPSSCRAEAGGSSQSNESPTLPTESTAPSSARRSP